MPYSANIIKRARLTMPELVGEVNATPGFQLEHRLIHAYVAAALRLEGHRAGFGNSQGNYMNVVFGRYFVKVKGSKYWLLLFVLGLLAQFDHLGEALDLLVHGVGDYDFAAEEGEFNIFITHFALAIMCGRVFFHAQHTVYRNAEVVGNFLCGLYLNTLFCSIFKFRHHAFADFKVNFIS